MSRRQLGFWHLARENPEQIAVVDNQGQTITAGRLLASADILAHDLRRRGLKAGDVLAVALDNSTELLALLLAALQSGQHFLPLPPSLPQASLQELLEHAQATVLICREGAQTPTDSRFLSLDDLPIRAGESPPPFPDRLAGAIMAITSGSTGLPKVVRRPLHGLSPEHLGRQAALHLQAVCGIQPRSGQVHLVASSLYHSASLAWCADHLHLGHTVVLMPVAAGWDPEVALQTIERHRVTGALLVPTHFRRLLSLPEKVRGAYDVGSLRHVVHTGSPCPPEVKRAMLRWWGPVIYEVYGSTEGPGTRIGPQEWLDHPGSVGRGHQRVRILRPDGSLCPVREPGEVLLKGPQGFVSAGDIGYLDEEDYLFLLGRKDDVLLSGGQNVHPAELEAVLLAHPEVEDAAVLGVADPEWGQRLVALVKPTFPGRALAESLRAHCRANLPAGKRPREYLLATHLPRDPQGKLRRGELSGAGPPLL